MVKKGRPFCILLSKMRIYRRDFDETNYMSSLLEIYNKIWENLSNSIRIKFDSKPLSNKKYLKTKIKSYYSQHKLSQR